MHTEKGGRIFRLTALFSYFRRRPLVLLCGVVYYPVVDFFAEGMLRDVAPVLFGEFAALAARLVYAVDGARGEELVLLRVLVVGEGEEEAVGVDAAALFEFVARFLRADVDLRVRDYVASFVDYRVGVDVYDVRAAAVHFDVVFREGGG